MERLYKKMKKQKGFTLIELVIVIAIIGILALMIIPHFNRVTEDAKIKTFQSNCKIIIIALGTYQASHDGDMPDNESELGTCMNGGWDSLKSDNEFYPPGALYSYDGNVFIASYTDGKGTIHSYQYPQ